VKRSPAAQTPTPGGRYRRSPTLVLYWTPKSTVALDSQTGRRTPLAHELVPYVVALTEWTSPADVASRHPDLGAAGDVEALFEGLAQRGIFQREDDAPSASPWADWSPEAAFFHFGTRDVRYAKHPESDAYDVTLRAKARQVPQPAPTKLMSGPTLDLPTCAVQGSLADTLATRRTWRRFGRRALPLPALATLLHETFAVQRWGMVPGQGRVALKTSPSGGARHAIEAYVITLRVDGLKNGVFHYDAARKCLVDRQRVATPGQLAAALAHQRYFLRAAALVVMTAVFARAMWRYPYSRAYRSILTETGHLGQTFCLAATALQLAPFCTMAFRETDLEMLLGVDGINESAMYVVGVGTRPAGNVEQPGRIPQRLRHAER